MKKAQPLAVAVDSESIITVSDPGDECPFCGGYLWSGWEEVDRFEPQQVEVCHNKFSPFAGELAECITCGAILCGSDG